MAIGPNGYQLLQNPFSNNGRDTRSSTDRRSDLRVRSPEASGVHADPEGSLASDPRRIPTHGTRARDDGALADALGGWLTGEYQAEINQLSDDVVAMRSEVAESNDMRGIYRDMWQQAEAALEAQRNDMQWAIEARERVINMLFATLYRSTILSTAESTTESQLNLCSSYVDELIDSAAGHAYNSVLRRPDIICDEVYQEVMREDLAGMTTESDSSDSEVIDLTTDEVVDLTYDSDSEMEI